MNQGMKGKRVEGPAHAKAYYRKELGESEGWKEGKVPGSGAVGRTMVHDELRAEGRVRPKNVWDVLRSFDVIYMYVYIYI